MSSRARIPTHEKRIHQMDAGRVARWENLGHEVTSRRVPLFRLKWNRDNLAWRLHVYYCSLNPRPTHLRRGTRTHRRRAGRWSRSERKPGRYEVKGDKPPRRGVCIIVAIIITPSPPPSERNVLTDSTTGFCLHLPHFILYNPRDSTWSFSSNAKMETLPEPLWHSTIINKVACSFFVALESLATCLRCDNTVQSFYRTILCHRSWYSLVQLKYTVITIITIVDCY